MANYLTRSIHRVSNSVPSSFLILLHEDKQIVETLGHFWYCGKYKTKYVRKMPLLPLRSFNVI